MCAYLAFYKGPGNWMDKLVRWWTRSKYSHCELVVGEYWYSSSYRDGGVRAQHESVYDRENWDFVDVRVNEDKFRRMFSKAEGSGYDWLGIFLSEFIPLGVDNKSKWYCSEFCASAIGLYMHVSPGELHAMVS